MTLFHHAALRGSTAILEALRSSFHGAPPPPDPQFREEVCHKNKLSSEAYLFSRDNQGRTPVALACTLKDRSKALACITLMLSWSRRPDLVLLVTDNKKRLPIHHAMMNREGEDHDTDVSIVSFLLAQSCKAHVVPSQDEGKNASRSSSSSGWLPDGAKPPSSILTKLASRAKSTASVTVPPSPSHPPANDPPGPPLPPPPALPPPLDPSCTCSSMACAVDSYGIAPLHLACFSNNAPLTKLLMARGAMLMARTTATCLDGSVVCDSLTTPLHLAAMHNSFDAARELLTYWAALTSIDRMMHWDPSLIGQIPSAPPPATSTSTAQSSGSDSKGKKGKRIRGGTIDPRLLKDSRGKLPFDIALGRRHESLSDLLDPSQPLPGLKNEQELPIDTPQAFLCPITCDLMFEPVVASDGNSYELVAIERWLEDHTTSPLSNVELNPKNLYPNRALQQLIDEFREKKGIVKQKPRMRPGPSEPKKQGFQQMMGPFGLPIVHMGTSELNGTDPFAISYIHSSYR